MNEYGWNEVAGRYIGSDGRFVSFATVRSHLDSVLDSYEQRVLTLAQQLRERTISLRDWQYAMKDALKDIHLASGALARGGWQQMSPADYGRVGNVLRFQYERLNAFSQQIANGLPLDGRFIQRVRLYVQSGRTSYTRALTQEMELRGMTEERSVLAAADHCSECLNEAAKGWVEIGTLINIGERICRGNCRCHKTFR